MKKFLLLLVVPLLCIGITFAQSLNGIDIDGILVNYGMSTIDDVYNNNPELQAAGITKEDGLGAVLDYYAGQGVDVGTLAGKLGMTSGQLTAAIGNMRSTVDSYQGTIDVVNGTMDDIAKVFCGVVPNLATMTNVYPDAYIGQLWGLPPHFALGLLNVSATMMDVKPVKAALDAIGGAGTSSAIPTDYLALPTLAFDIRLGGIILPFDFGVGINVLNKGMLGGVAGIFGAKETVDSMFDDYGLNVDFLTVALDFRYNILKEGVFRPNISVGGGYTYLGGAIGANVSGISVDFAYKTHMVYLSAQVSKKILFITPYIGAKLSTEYVRVDWSYGLDVLEPLNKILEASGEAPIPLSYGNTVKKPFFTHFIPQLYGGIGINLFVIRLNTAVSYDIARNLPSASVSLRFQL